MTTSYDNAGGKGDRRSTITATTDADVVGTFTNIIDGTYNNNNTYFSGNSSERSMLFDFGVDAVKVIDEFTWYQSGPGEQGTWTVRASQDNADWTTLATGVTFGVTATDVVAFTNADPYRYYSLLKTAGSTNNGPYIREIEFKIDDYVAPEPPAAPAAPVKGAKGYRILAGPAGFDHLFRTVTVLGTGPNSGFGIGNQATDNDGGEIETVYAGPTGAAGFKTVYVAGYTGPA
jgi:hypothetical protein